ncbi:hypothetical protein KY290_023855 [Solanum tuberosum]|uniref:Ninja-family protein n=1 Tax=Solanum tuberosum TaxID=4113 RepID=A0ABQ7UP10_SOLTU|nr:hypothetical protein KY290_023855 [Solanum tuberosum]
MEVLNMHVHVRIDEKRKSRIEMENLSMETNRFSRDLLQRFMGGGGSSSSSSGKSRVEVVVAGGKEVKEEEDEGEVELNLGLSLGGRFGVDKSSNSNKLIRSSSVASCLPIVRDDDTLAPPPVSYPTLVRTSSLPVETEEEWRKRKELQTLRRMEAKRRRSEKQRNLRGDKEGGGGSTVVGGGGSMEDEKREIEMNLRGRLDKEQYLASAKRFGLSVSPTLAAVSRQGSLTGGGIDLTMGKGKGSYSGGKMQGHGKLGSQGSVESQGGGSSSSMSELESKLPQGSGELSPASIHSLQGGGSQDIGLSGSKMRETGSRMSGGDMDSPSKKLEAAKSRAKETGTNTSENMPCVFTKGDGPNGKRVDGILYRYSKGEEVRIMCVCHGSFHSPAEFVKHAGGTDVAHPLKHIVINPNASPLL